MMPNNSVCKRQIWCLETPSSVWTSGVLLPQSWCLTIAFANAKVGVWKHRAVVGLIGVSLPQSSCQTIAFANAKFGVWKHREVFGLTGVLLLQS